MAKFVDELIGRGVSAATAGATFANLHDYQKNGSRHRLLSRALILSCILTGVYWLAAKLGLLLALVHPSATAVWPPTGIALAALLVLGYKVWPGIFFGAFLANVFTAGTAATSIGIAVGNTLEAVLGAYLVNRFAHGRKAFDRPEDVFRFALLAAMLSTTVSATFGVTSLYLGGYANWSDYGSIWVTWWLGDAGGSLLVAPFLILWATNPHIRWKRNEILEAALLLIVLFVDGYLVFGGLLPVTVKTYPLAFLCVAMLIWTGLRFGQRETVTAHFMLSGIAIMGTLRGLGPFAREAPNESLLLLQAFMGVIGVMVMALAASVSEHRRAEAQVRELNASLEARVLQRTRSLRERSMLLQEANKRLREESAERKRAEESIQRNLDRIRSLREIEVALTSSLDLQTILDVLLEKIDLFLPYPTATTVRLLNRGTRELESLACRNIGKEEWKRQEVKVLSGHAKSVVESQAPKTIRNIVEDPQTRDPNFYLNNGLVSVARFPLIAKDEVLGVLGVYTKQEHEFSEEEMDFLTTIAAQAAMAIHNSQLYDQLRHQAIELEIASKAKDEFLSVMSHELRTPLNVVVGYAAMLKDGLLGSISAQQRDGLGKIIKQTNDQLVMINGLLQVARLKAGAARAEWEEVELLDFMDEMKSTYEVPNNKGVTLKWDYPSSLPSIRTDRDKLKHILQNLINNAIKFTERGHVIISVRYLSEADKLEMKVADTGIGIPQEKVPIIFDMFRQLDSSETRLYGGVGLGLYIVKKFVELTGGNVELESELGKGSSFTVALPRNTEKRLASV